jgi:hypothetical protein
MKWRKRLTTTTYSFIDQLEQGQHWEGVLDEYFSTWYTIREATRDEQRKGIDRWFRRIPGPGGQDITRTHPAPIAVEYKADDKTDKTGNVFIETDSVVEKDKPGWAWKSEADILVYLAIPDTLYIAQMKNVRRMIPEWRRGYGTRNVHNQYWTSRGIPVPEEAFQMICDSVRRLV